ncbi:putative polyol transporter 6 [Curcuma longa]|uniref:putative polyol transporter 6 n=1 Tax=Curcuma longa TaxID=136217 RepID=UPI003D9F97F7
MPESPWWLVMQGLVNDAHDILLCVGKNEEVAEQQWEEIKAAMVIDRACACDGKVVWREILRPTPAVRRALMTTADIHMFQHATEIDLLIYGWAADTGIMSGATLLVQDDLNLSDKQIQIFGGIFNACAVIGSLTAGRISDLIGRRYTIIIGAVIFLVGSVLMGLDINFALLLFDRCIAGVGVGVRLMIAPVYSAEISSTSSRGLLISLLEIYTSLGILIGYLANFGFGRLPLFYNWRVMLGIAAIASIALATCIARMPKSPRWLVIQGSVNDARDILLCVSNSEEEVEQQLEEIKAAMVIDRACTGDGIGVWREILRPTPAVRRALMTTADIHVFQHATRIGLFVLFTGH